MSANTEQRKESEMAVFVLKELRSLLKDHEDLHVDKEKAILTDVTCVPAPASAKTAFQLIHGFSKTDIVVYREINIDTIEPTFLKFYKDSADNTGKFAIPLVVIELKASKDLHSDNIRSRDHVASKIKEIFPYAAYYFVAENTMKEQITLIRQGKSFTNYFIYKARISKKDIKEIFDKYIKPHIANLEDQFKQIAEQ